MDPISYRPSGLGDLEDLAATSVAGYQAYLSFAPAGWEPPTPAEETAWLARQLEPEGVWTDLALRGGEPAGHLIAMPAAVSRVPDPDPALGHLLHLFVRPAHWGSGVALGLHERGLAEASARGFAQLRLFTPAPHARARRFYEREGWEAAGPPRPEPEFGMDIVEYRRPL